MMQKLSAVTLGGIAKGLGLAGTVGLGGLTAYDVYKSYALRHPELADMFSENAVDTREFLKTVPDKVKLVSSKRGLRSMVKKELEDHYGKDVSEAFQEHVGKNIQNASNAFLLPGKKENYLVAAKKINPNVILHELGHARDFSSLREKYPEDPMEHYRRGKSQSFLRGLGRTLWKPWYEEDVMTPERRAWELSGVKEDADAMRDAALKSYERSFHGGRGALAGGTLGAILGGKGGSMLAQKLRMNPLGQLGATIYGSLLGTTAGALPAFLVQKMHKE